MNGLLVGRRRHAEIECRRPGRSGRGGIRGPLVAGHPWPDIAGHPWPATRAGLSLHTVTASSLAGRSLPQAAQWHNSRTAMFGSALKLILVNVKACDTFDANCERPSGAVMACR